MSKQVDSFTLTYGDRMESHQGMQIVGTMSDKGFSEEDLNKIKEYFDELGAVTELIYLNEFLPKELPKEKENEEVEKAYLLIIKNGVNCIYPNLSENLKKEHSRLEYDKHYYDTRRSKVLNKLARWNLCFDDVGQVADFKNKKGTIVAYEDVPFTKLLRANICSIVNDNLLKLEANYYYDITKTGIKDHGDGERRKVVGVRIGKNNPLAFKWYYKSEHIGTKFEIVLSDGDIYVMSEKAVGTDWKKRNILTLRHSAGCSKYTK